MKIINGDYRSIENIIECIDDSNVIGISQLGDIDNTQFMVWKNIKGVNAEMALTLMGMGVDVFKNKDGSLYKAIITNNEQVSSFVRKGVRSC